MEDCRNIGEKRVDEARDAGDEPAYEGGGRLYDTHFGWLFDCSFRD